MENKILSMIYIYEENNDFYGCITIERIQEVEKDLEVKFPLKYKNFIQGYGSGGICGVNILGIEGNDGASVLTTTERYRELGLRKNLIVIEDLGEFIMCSETGDNESILYWDRIEKQETIRYDNFQDYLIDTFQEAIDNWD